MQSANRWRWRGGAVLLAVLSSATALAVAGTPAAASPDAVPAASGNAFGTPTVTADAWAAGRAQFGRSVSAAQAVESFWTPERMRSARKVEDSAAYLTAVKKYEKTVADAKSTALRQPLRQAATQATPRTVAPQKNAAVGAGTQAGGPVPAAVNPGYAYWHPTARTSGKVFFVMGGLSYQCSGTIVNSEGQDTVWTAGHCVHGGSGGAWASNWQFVPSYDDDLVNPRPYGTWTATGLWSRTAWTNSSDFAEDMGVAIMGTNFGGWHIVSYLGGQGIQTGVGRVAYEYAFGYPAEWPFDGGNLYRCQGWSSAEWEVLWWWSETIKIPCDMTRGSSGGGWLHDWDGNWGYLNGVNSRIDRIVNPTIMLSPYFDDTAWSLYNATRFL